MCSAKTSTPSDYGLFVTVQPIEFARVLSNLINNAVEAIESCGLVHITVSSLEPDFVELTICDTGKGIPTHVLPRLMQRGATHGKVGGSGLGLDHARECLESWGGRLSIASKPGQGTTVTLQLKKSPVPAWFPPSLPIDLDTPIVVVDDDPSIHELWQGRIGRFAPSIAPLIVHVHSASGLRAWLRKSPEWTHKALYLIDQELGQEHGLDGNQKSFGTSLIRDFRLQKNAILVTSRADEMSTQEACLDLGVKLLPKSLAPLVPFLLRAHTEANHRQISDS
jgi:hypothetical protein